jgi:hypothetical protein
MKKLQLSAAAFFLAGYVLIAWGFASKAPPPKIEPKIPTRPTASALKDVLDFAGASSCAKHGFTGKGRPIQGYVKGMAAAFTKSFCKKRTSAREALGTHAQDALTFYGITSGSDKLVDTYTLLFGLGLRESDGRYCCGRDRGAGNTSSETAEAGPFQTSWNARSADPSLIPLFKEYQNGKGCFLDLWKEGVSQSYCAKQGPLYGSGDGRKFQELSRTCPAFAAEFAAIVIRNLKSHYGPLKRKEAEFAPECRAMFTAIREAVKSKPEICGEL